MVRILVLGDSHIPEREKEIPPQFYDKVDDLSKNSLFDFTFFTGDVINYPELIDYLNSKSNTKMLMALGNMDYYYGNRSAPLYQKLDINFDDHDKITIGLTHGTKIRPRGDHSQLENLAIEKSYNILISGHTHKEEIFLTEKGILLINPGSMTGAWSFVASRIPSFVELQINEITKEIIVNLNQIDKQSRENVVLKSKFFFKNNQITEKF
ncbi:MAG: YfcE family phosphodiesterase [Promethearchaeota archaeon]|jgi:putative phosphoesterase